MKSTIRQNTTTHTINIQQPKTYIFSTGKGTRSVSPSIAGN